MSNEKERWADVPDYEGRYKISSLGCVVKIINEKTTKELKQTDRANGYLSVHLRTDEGKYRFYSVHRLVALAFIKNPNGFSQINHINEDKQDNRVENLEWCSASHNINWGTRNTKVAGKLGRPIIAIRLKDGAILRFASLSEARRQGYSPNRISQSKDAVRYCGLCKHSEYVWKWEDDAGTPLPIIIDKRIPVIGISLSDGSILEFESIRDTRRFGFTRNSVRRALLNGTSYKGYVWKHKV